jgi:hypothetical protein
VKHDTTTWPLTLLSGQRLSGFIIEQDGEDHPAVVMSADVNYVVVKGCTIRNYGDRRHGGGSHA